MTEEKPPTIELKDLLRQLVAATLFNLAVRAHPPMLRGLIHAVVAKDQAHAMQAAQAQAERVRKAQVGMDPN